MNSLSLEKVLRNPKCYMDTQEKFHNKLDLHNLYELKVLKDPSNIPIVLKKKIKKNRNKIGKIYLNDKKFTNHQEMRINDRIKNIDEHLNQIKNIQDYSFKALKSRNLETIKHFRYHENINKSNRDYETINVSNSCNNFVSMKREFDTIFHRNCKSKVHDKKNEIKEIKEINDKKQKEIIILPELNRQNSINNFTKNIDPKTMTTDQLLIETNSDIKFDTTDQDEMQNELLAGIENSDLKSIKTNKYYHKLIKLKNYDVVVKTLTNVKNLVTFTKDLKNKQKNKNITKSLDATNKNLPNIIKTNCFKKISGVNKNESLDAINSQINDIISIFPVDNEQSLADKLNEGNHRIQSEEERENIEKKSKSIDVHKVELLKIYKTTPAKEEILNKIKKNKNIFNLENYQRLLIDQVRDKFSFDAMNNLTTKFRELKEDLTRKEILPPFDSEKELSKLSDMVYNIKSFDLRKNIKIQEDAHQDIRHKYIRKDKIDYNLKKIEHCIPNYLLEKFKNNKK